MTADVNNPAFHNKAYSSPGLRGQSGFSLVELMLCLVITLVMLGVAVMVFSSALGTRAREASKTDAIVAAQAALNIMSREIGNAGYGLDTNGLGYRDINGNYVTDCTQKRLHFRANSVNTANSTLTDSLGEDVTFFYDVDSQSVVRYDPAASTPGTSGVINRVSDVNFTYYNYTFNALTGTVDVASATTPAANTARVNVKLTVILGEVQGQPTNQSVTISSDVNLRNSPFMLSQY